MRSRVLRAAVVAVVIATFLLLAVVGCARDDVVAPPGRHPSYAAGQACGSCKADKHDFVHAQPYAGECSRCHALSSWTRVQYDHADTGFDQGLHAVIGCPFCHTAATPQPTARCEGCHVPNVHRLLPDCGKCHTPVAWRVPKELPKGHPSLVNGHADLTCFDCHRGPTAFTAPRSCVSCHGKRHGGLTDCGACHDPKYHWKAKPGFRHERYYRLIGRHRMVRCTRCHPGYDFVSTRPVCSSCHGSRHGGLTDCSRCHTTGAFRPSTFRHSSVWTLTGAHTRLACSKCHPSNQYARAIGSPGRCASCHGSRHGGLTDCARCHTTSAFRPSTFRHSSVWTLAGAHSRLACSKCHPSNRYARALGSPSRCTNCHGVKHGNQTNCAKCHTTTSFSPAREIAHPGPPALGGEHAARPCTLCHPSLNFATAPKPCADCHSAPHMTAGRGCLDCHRPTVWSSMSFGHSEVGYHTGLPITDVCQYCHTNNTFSSYVCDQCHGPL